MLHSLVEVHSHHIITLLLSSIIIIIDGMARARLLLNLYAFAFACLFALVGWDGTVPFGVPPPRAACARPATQAPPWRGEPPPPPRSTGDSACALRFFFFKLRLA